MTLGDGQVAGEPAALPLDLAIESESTEVAADRREGQRLTGAVRLTNRGTAPLTVELEPTTSDMRWRVELERAKVTVPAGGRQAIR